MSYLGWDSRYLSGVIHLDGVEWTDQGIPLGMTWDEAPDEDLFLIQTASGEHVLQSQFSGVASSDQPSRWIFQLPHQLISENVFRRLKMAKAKGAEVNFVPNLWDMEHFDGAQAADVFSLSRPVAWTVASGVTSVTHPAVFYKDGVIDADCASLGGTLSQVLTVAEAGDIAVWYMPVFKVVVRELGAEFTDVGSVVYSATLEEVRRYA